MNFITHTHAFSLFPRSSLCKKISYLSIGDESEHDGYFDSFARRTDACFSHHNVKVLKESIVRFDEDMCEFGHRHLGDKRTWSISYESPRE